MFCFVWTLFEAESRFYLNPKIFKKPWN